MTSQLSIFAARLRDHIELCVRDFASSDNLQIPGWQEHADAEFNGLALMLFTLQFEHNAAYRRICSARGIQPNDVAHWTQIPAVPTAAFKELDLSCLHPELRTRVFYSSGTTEQRPSRHFHNEESLPVYEASLWAWFNLSVASSSSNLDGTDQSLLTSSATRRAMILTPPPAQAPRSSLVHMFDVVRQKLGASEAAFLGRTDAEGAWTLDLDATFRALSASPDHGIRKPELILGTAFSFVHLLDHLAANSLKLQLPAESIVMETGGYKGRSRTMPKAELHALITERLGVPRSHIICEYGMSELSSQAYDSPLHPAPANAPVGVQSRLLRDCSPSTLKPELQPAALSYASRAFHFPPWARVVVVSTETGREVAEGETGLLRVLDLANVFSVMAIQTEDLAGRRSDGFELLGRAASAEPRGCSLKPT